MRKQLSLTKRIAATAVAFILAFVFILQPLKVPVFAAEGSSPETTLDKSSKIYELDKTAPKEYSTTPDSAYDNVQDAPFLLSKQNELYLLSSNSTTKRATIFDTVDLSDYTSSGTKVNESILKQSINITAARKTNEVTNGMSNFSNLDYTEGVAFDPTGSGRKDHVAVFGLTYTYANKKYSYNTKFVVQNTKNGSTYSLDLDYPMNWMHESNLWTSGSYFSITAGDYDHDGKDSVMIYASGDKYFKIYEIKLNGTGLSYSEVFDVGAVLLRSRNDFVGEKVPAYLKPVVSLTTGDLDGDGTDELAYMAGYYKTFNKKDGHKGDISSLEPYSSHISILENNNGRWSATSPVYMYTKGKSAGDKNSYSYQIMHGGGIAAGDVDGDGVDDLVAVGYTSNGCVVKFKNGKISSTEKLEYFDEGFYACSIVKYAGGGYKFSDVKTIKTSNFFQAHFSNSDKAFQPITVACAKVSGDKLPEHVFINGAIFNLSDNSPMPVFEGDMKRDLGSMLGGLDEGRRVDSSVNWIQNVTVGNFDGNDMGREQFAFVALEKHYGKEMYSANLGVIAGVEYETNKDSKTVSYGTVTKFASSFYVEQAYRHNYNVLDRNDPASSTQIFVDSSHSTHGNHLAFLPIAIDNDDDGILVRQGKKMYAYTDPNVVAVLQAGPYYEELNKGDYYGGDSCETVYSFETSYEYATSTSDNVSFGCGITGEVQWEHVKVAVEAGYTLDWTHGFEESTGQTYTTEFAVGDEDAVVVQRIPEVIYSYDVYQNGRWIKDGYTISVAGSPIFFLLTIDDYNDFVDDYNNKIGKQELKKITDKEMPADHIGNPFGYYKSLLEAGGDAVKLSKSDYSCSPGTGSITSSYSLSESVTESSEMSHGFSFSLTLQFGKKLGSVAEGWIGGYANLEYSHSSGSSKTRASAKGSSGTVVNPNRGLMKEKMDENIINEYHFTWSPIMWTRELQDGERVPFCGYMVSSVSAPTIPVSDFDGEFKNAGQKKTNIVLTWSDPGTEYRPTKGYVIYQYDDKGNKTRFASLGKNVTEYIVENVNAADEYKFTIAAVGANTSTQSIESEPVVLSAKNKNIYDIQMSGTEDLVDTYTIYYTDGTTSEFTVKNGEKGEKGDKGDPGEKGEKGDPGASGGGGGTPFRLTVAPLTINQGTTNIGFVLTYPDGSKLYCISDGMIYVSPDGTQSYETITGLSDMLNLFD